MKALLEETKIKAAQCDSDLKNFDHNIAAADKSLEALKRQYPNIEYELAQSKSKLDQLDP